MEGVQGAIAVVCALSLRLSSVNGGFAVDWTTEVQGVGGSILLPMQQTSLSAISRVDIRLAIVLSALVVIGLRGRVFVGVEVGRRGFIIKFALCVLTAKRRY